MGRSDLGEKLREKEEEKRMRRNLRPPLPEVVKVSQLETCGGTTNATARSSRAKKAGAGNNPHLPDVGGMAHLSHLFGNKRRGQTVEEE